MIVICYTWANADISWSMADWEWQKCQTFDCVKWNTAGIWWKQANWVWAGCSGSYVPPIPPTPPITESVVRGIVQPLGVDATTLIQPWLIEPWNPYRAGEIKKKKMITLICKVGGQEFNEEKEAKDFDVMTEGIKLEVGVGSNINLELKDE